MKTEKDEKSEPILKGEKNDIKPVEEKHVKPELMFKNKPEINKEKEDPLYNAKKKLTLRDAILTLLGNELYRITFGSLWVIFNLTTYLMSYLRLYQEEKTITLQYNYFIGPIMSITMGLFTPTVGYLEHKLGLKLCIVLGSILNLWFTIILYLSKNYYFDLFSFFVNSLGSSLGALMSRNLMGYFFHIRGKLSGVLSIVGSLVSSAYNVIGEKWIVNPNSEEATLEGGYYTFEVCKNLLVYIKFCWICMIIGTILTVIFVVPYDQKKHVRLFVPKNFKGFDKSKMKQFNKKELKKDKIQVDENIGSLMPDDEVKKEDKIDTHQDSENDDIIKIDKEKEFREKERDKEKEKDIKINVKNKNKNDFSKTASVPAFLISDKDKLLYNSLINENNNSENNEKGVKPLKKKRSQSISYKQSRMKMPLLNIIPEIEAVAIVPSEKPKKKFNIQLIRSALKSRRVLFLFLMGIFSSPLGNFLGSTWRPLGIKKGIPTKYLQDIGTYRPFITCAASLIFSTLSDYCPFRYLYCLFSILSTIVGVTFYFTLNSPFFFTSLILLNSIIFTGKMSITGPHYMKVFGLKYYIEIGGVIGLSRVFMSPLCTIFIFLFETYLAAPEGKINDLAYIILFISTGLLNAISAFLSLFETEEEYSPD